MIAATEMSLTANQEAIKMDAAHAALGPDPWGTGAAAGRRKWLNSRDATLYVTIYPMEVRTFAVTLG